MSNGAQAAIERVRDALAKATPGEWATGSGYEYLVIDQDGKTVASTGSLFVKFAKEDAEFIATAHNDLPALLAELTRLQVQLTYAHRYAAFCHSCALSGEQPQSYAEFLAEIGDYTNA